MAERTTEIRPYTEQETRFMQKQLTDYPTAVPNGETGRHFNIVGGFVLTEKLVSLRDILRHDDSTWLSFHPMWAGGLLAYNPNQCKLTTYQGQLIVRDSENRVLKSIPPAQIRRLSIESERGTVRESGYVLADHYYVIDGQEGIQVDEFEQILRSADEGKEPTGFSHYTMVKVDPELAGRELWVGVFEFELSRDVWDRDAVVVDPETRQMIAREVGRPLHPERWGKKFHILDTDV